MTIAAGLFSIDGVVLAADTKESYGEVHTYVDKLESVSTEYCNGAIAGSGDGYLLDYVTPCVLNLMRSKITTSGEFEDQLRELMVTLYQSPAVKSYPIDKSSDLYTQFLVATKHRDDVEAAIFVINSTLVTRSTKLGTVIGCGPLRQVAEELGTVSPFGINRAKGAAVCIVNEAKRRYSDVSGHTQAVAIKNSNDLTIYDVEDLAKLEALLDRIRHLTNTITTAVLDASMDGPRFSRILSHSVSELRDLHRKAKTVEEDAEKDRNRRVARMLQVVGRRRVKRLASRKLKDRQ